MRNILLLLVFFLTVSLNVTAQENNSTYYIDVLIDGNKNIYFKNKIVGLEQVSKMTRDQVNNLKFVEGKSITYRIFAAGELPLGVIMDVNDQMRRGFSQPGVATRKYLLSKEEMPLDKSNWIEQLNKLDLKAIEEH